MIWERGTWINKSKSTRNKLDTNHHDWILSTQIALERGTRYESYPLEGR